MSTVGMPMTEGAMPSYSVPKPKPNAGARPPAQPQVQPQPQPQPQAQQHAGHHAWSRGRDVHMHSPVAEGVRDVAAGTVDATAATVTLQPGRVVDSLGTGVGGVVQAGTLGLVSNPAYHHHHHPGNKETPAPKAGSLYDPDEHCFMGPACDGCTDKRCRAKAGAKAPSAPAPKAGARDCPWNGKCADLGGCPACDGAYSRGSGCSSDKAGDHYMGTWQQATQCDFDSTGDVQCQTAERTVIDRAPRDHVEVIECSVGDGKCRRVYPSITAGEKAGANSKNAGHHFDVSYVSCFCDRTDARCVCNSAAGGYGRAKEAQKTAGANAAPGMRAVYNIATNGDNCISCSNKVAGAKCPCGVTKVVDYVPDNTPMAGAPAAGANEQFALVGAHSNGVCRTCNQYASKRAGACPCRALRLVPN